MKLKSCCIPQQSSPDSQFLSVSHSMTRHTAWQWSSDKAKQILGAGPSVPHETFGGQWSALGNRPNISPSAPHNLQAKIDPVLRGQLHDGYLGNVRDWEPSWQVSALMYLFHSCSIYVLQSFKAPRSTSMRWPGSSTAPPVSILAMRCNQDHEIFCLIVDTFLIIS